MSYVEETLLVAAFGFAIVTLVIGLLMLVIPDKVHAFAARMDVYISTEKYFAVFDKTKNIERYFYQYHRVFGVFIVLASGYTLFALFGTDIPYHKLPEIIHPVVSEWLYDAGVNMLLVLNAIVVIVGLVVFFRPSLLKGIEAKMNKWVDSSAVVKELDTQRFLEQQKPLKRPRLYGAVVFLASVYILWQTAPYL